MKDVERGGPIRDARVWKVRGRSARKEQDRLAVEEPMEIRVESGPPEARRTTSLSVTMRTPGNDFDLAAGFLFTEGIVVRPRDIQRIEYCTDPGVAQEYNIVSAVLGADVSFREDRLSRHFYMTSSCGVCGKTALDAVRVAVRHPLSRDDFVLDGARVAQLPEKLRAKQTLFSETGGLHAAGLFDDDGGLRNVREDVGRHNAVDKVLGDAFLAGRTPLSASGLAVSGRGSFEILQKAAVAGVPFVIAVGAPSSLAVAIAEEFGMTLVGFARGERFNVYTGGGRIPDLPARDSGKHF